MLFYFLRMNWNTVKKLFALFALLNVIHSYDADIEILVLGINEETYL